MTWPRFTLRLPLKNNPGMTVAVFNTKEFEKPPPREFIGIMLTNTETALRNRISATFHNLNRRAAGKTVDNER